MTANENQIVVYQPSETVRLDVRLENETVWLTQLKIAELFGVQKAAISKHIKNIFASGELVRDATVSKMETVQDEGGRMVVRLQEFFNLDVIIAVGYRVNSQRATQFRIWATNVLKDYLLRGYAVNQRLNQLEDKVDRRLAKHDDDIAELKDKVDFFVQTKEPPLQSIFYQGRYWDAKSLLIKFIRRAKKELVVIDAYPGVVALDMLAKRGRGVKVELVTHSNGELAESDFEAFGKQCGTFTKTICGICHDRFIIVDGKEVFWKMRRRNALCVSEGRFGESRTRRAHKRPRCLAQGRRSPYFRRGENGWRNHPRSSRLNPQGDIGSPRIRQRQAA
ncbi:MAG: virulence RhuM family protein [Kiritimatiellae bacterium]|nr:virulence RhuM family protein [Kiritimatiellia bacterium]